MFAENDKISKRQFQRQIGLSCVCIGILFITQIFQKLSVGMIVGSIAGILLLICYSCFLTKISHKYESLGEQAGIGISKVILLIYYVYMIFLGGVILSETSEIVCQYLLEDIPKELISLFIILVIMIGRSKDGQIRARITEVFYPIFVVISLITILMLLKEVSYEQLEVVGKSLMEEGMKINTSAITSTNAGMLDGVYQELSKTMGVREAIRALINIVALGAGVAVLPFLIGKAKIQHTADRTIRFILGSSFLIVFGLFLFYNIRFGMTGYQYNAWTKISLIHSSSMWWTSFYVLSLFIILGNVMSCGEHILDKGHIRGGWFVFPIGAYVLQFLEYTGFGLRELFVRYVTRGFLPLFIIISIGLYFYKRENKKESKRKNRKNSMGKKAVVGMFVCMMCASLTACGQMEPEKQAFPQAVSVDYKEGQYRVILGMPNLPGVTGQAKEDPQENKESLEHVYEGADFSEIKAAYERKESKKLELWHVQVVILGESLVDHQEQYFDLLKILDSQEFLNEQVYILESSNPDSIMQLNGKKIDSIGEYLNDMIKKREKSLKDQARATQLQHLYYLWHEQECIPRLVKVEEKDGNIWVDFD